MTASAAFSSADGLRYGLLGLPLAFVALPLYVVLPNHYAREFDVPLAALGAVARWNAVKAPIGTRIRTIASRSCLII